jgi:hypothetical protein
MYFRSLFLVLSTSRQTFSRIGNITNKVSDHSILGFNYQVFSVTDLIINICTDTYRE